MSETIELICFNCKHFNETAPGCKAFPEGIPDIILRTNQHNEPLPEQKNNLVYEPVAEQTKP